MTPSTTQSADTRRQDSPRDRPEETTDGPAPHLEKGRIGEFVATDFLEQSGLEVVSRNWRIHTDRVRGEIDIVARDGDELVFIEVKTRRSKRFGGPLIAVSVDKQRRIRALARSYMQTTGTRSRRVRFDVIGVVLVPATGRAAHWKAHVRHIKAAF